nr:hypothetical protein [Tanacetum cinerariifolium]
MADQRTMAETAEGYAKAIVVPQILAEQFELKHSLINMMTSDQFFGLEKDNPHDHIRWFNKITSTIKYKDMPNSAIKFMLFPFSLAGAARRTTNLRNEISNFQQRFDESFHEAWDRYKDLLRACPHHGFTEFHKLDTFYNALNPADQDYLNAAAGGNLLERRTQDVLTIIENKSKIAKLTHAVNQQMSAVTTAMTAILKQFKATSHPAYVKAVEEICVTCGGAHSYYQCLAAGGNTFPELWDNIQGYVSAAAFNYNQGNSVYRPPGMANQIRPPGFAQPNVQNNQNRFSQPQGFNRGNNFNPEQSYQASTQQNQIVPLNELKKVKRINEANMKAMQTQINIVKNELRNEMKNSIHASFNTVANPKGKLKAITTRSGIVVNGPTVPTPPPSINPKKDECVEETLTDPDLSDYTIKVPPPPKKLGLLELISTRMTLELANRAIYTPVGIARDVFAPVGKFTFPTDFVIVDYESDPRVPLILGRPFLRTACALIDVYGEQMILHDGDERLTLNMRHDTSSYSNQPQKESINLINIFDNLSEDFLEDLFSTNQPSGNPTFHPELTSPEVKDDIFDPEGCNVLPEKLLDLDSNKDLHPPLHINPLIGNTTYSYSPNPLLEEFTDELALITFPPKYDDDLQFDAECSPMNILLIIHPLRYSMNTMMIFLEVESYTENVYDEPFDSKGEKIKDSKLLINELDFPCDFLPPSEYDSFISQDFSRVDAKPSTNNEDNVFNPGILSQEKPFEIITRFVQDKKLATSNASLVLENFDPPFYEPLFFKEVPRSNMLLTFSS